MISMTGYATREKTLDLISVTVEIKGVNNRFLEINVILPPWLSGMEQQIKEHITSCCGRGKVDVYIRLREQNAPVSVSVNTAAAKAYYSAINDLAAELGISDKPDLSMLLGMDGVLETEKKRYTDPDKIKQYWDIIEPVYNETIKAFCSEREREGEHTEKDIIKNLVIIETSLIKVSSFAPVLEKTIKENIKTRFEEVMGNQIDEKLILAETASHLVKLTISEEISRLSSHLAEFRAEIERNKRPGKKLDFLCQELNREINTIGSKSTIVDVSSEIIIMKEAVENIREQLRNVE